MNLSLYRCTRTLIVLLLAALPVCAQPSAATVVPLQLINGLPYVAATVNEKGPYLFGLDTGFGAALELDAELAKELGLIPTGQTRVGDGSGQNEIELQTASVSQMAIGNFSKAIPEAVLRTNTRKNLPGMENVKGIIGMGFFEGRCFTLDYPKSLLSIQNTELPEANGLDLFDYQEVGGSVPLLNLQAGPFDLKAVIDSRSMSGSFKIPLDTARQLTFLDTPKLIGKGRTVSNTIDINQVKVKENIRLGQYVFESPTITYPSLNENAIIGAKLLQEFALTFDVKNKRLRMVKAPQSGLKQQGKSDEKLSEYTGQYGDRTITVNDGFLYIQRPNGMLLKMLPKAQDQFSLERVPEAIIQFERNAQQQIKAIKVSKGDNQWEVAEKTSN